MATASRVSKLWQANNAEIPEDKNLFDKPNENNLTNIILSLKKDDITYRFLMNIFGGFKDQTLAHPYDRLEVPIGKFTYYTDKEKKKSKSNKNKFITTLGLWIFNIYLRDFNFSRFFNGYFQQTIDKDVYGDIEQTLSYALIEDQITTIDFKNYENTINWLMPFETVISPNHTEKMITMTAVLDKKKNELLKKYKDKLDKGDVATVELIEKELLNYAKEYLGDDPSADTLDSGALGDWKNNFKNMYIMKGAIRDPDPNAKQRYNIVTGSYMDSIPANEYSIVAGAGAQGAYARGKKTENGGYFEKLFIAAYNHLVLDPPGSDCGTKKYITVNLTKDNIKDYMYSYMINPNSTLTLLDSTNMKNYIGKKVKFRFASMCESKTGICNKCAGELFYKMDNPRIGLSLSSIPDKLKTTSMKAFHNAQQTTITVDPYSAFYPFENE